MVRKSRLLPELGAILCLLLLPLVLFAPVALGTKTLLPADTLFLFEPYRAAAEDLGVSYPHNHLVADLILENYAWKSLAVEAVRSGDLPLWDPFVFAGHPFLANGQHSALYPLSVLFYVLPLWRAYGVFVWLQLGLAGAFMYLFVRVLGVSRLGSLIAGITFQFSGFMIVSVVHPMIVAGASWLPFILAMVELALRHQPALGNRSATLPWVLLGSIGLGCQMLAGHAENTYYVLLVTAAFALWRFAQLWLTASDGEIRASGQNQIPLLVRALWGPAALVGLGLLLGAVQFFPLYEVAANSFRGGEAAASLQQVRGWAYPWRRIITFLIPNFFGGPTQHGYFDMFDMRWVLAPARSDGRYLDWGIKNYVEGGAYLGLLPVFLALIGVVSSLVDSRDLKHSCGGSVVGALRRWIRHPHIPFFSLLALFSLGCVFGTPVYALVYALPYLKLSHSPFRWVFPLTVAVAVLAGFGVQVVQNRRRRVADALTIERRRMVSGLRQIGLLGASPSVVTVVAALAFWTGLALIAALGLSWLMFSTIEPVVDRVFQSLALAPSAFPDHRAFYSYEFRWAAISGLLLLGTGIALRLSQSSMLLREHPVWAYAAIGLLIVDFASFGTAVNPAVDPALLEYVPPVVEFLSSDPSVWRYATFTPPGTTKTMNANVGMFYGFQCVAGYDSLFSSQYAEYMGLIEAQDERQYNRIASFREWSSLDSPLTDLLNVKYIITEVEIPNPAKYQLVYQDTAVRVYENLAVMSRVFTLPGTSAVGSSDASQALRTYDVHQYVILDPEDSSLAPTNPGAAAAVAQRIAEYTMNEVKVDAAVAEPSWLVLTDSYLPGWKAFIRPLGTEEGAEEQVGIHRVDGNFRGVWLEPGEWTVRFKYSPDTVKLGAFISFLAGTSLLFMTGVYLWRFYYRAHDDVSTVRRVAKNSIAPIVINLFTRGIEMGFAALMARILGPVGNGRYATAINIYLWFDIIANFGLDMYLMREVARDRTCGRRAFLNTTILRLALFVVVVPVLLAFLASRQAFGVPLAPEIFWAIVLLYVGLLPSSVSNGLAALFRACEKHEYPAAIQTVTTIISVALRVLALVGGLGIVGLASASIVTNVATLVILSVLARRMVWPGLPGIDLRLGSATEGVDWLLQRTMLSDSWPLMVSLLLQALFPGVNILLLQSMQGDAVVGWYDAGRKWVDALAIVPSFFTFAIFPVVSRQAAQDPEELLRSYRLSVKLLTILTLPLALCMTLFATPLVGLLSGQRFLPHGASVLRLLVWSIVFGWINSLTNYVLIALHRQRYVLLASAARVVFTVIANMLFVRDFSYLASVWIMIAGEFLLTVLFAVDLRRHLGPVEWGRSMGRPILAGLSMGLVAWVIGPSSGLAALLLGWGVYVGVLFLLRVLSPTELKILAPLLPRSLRSRFVGDGQISLPT